MVEKAKRKIIITGVNGMLGSDLQKQFAAHYEICGTDITSVPAQAREFFCCDIRSVDQVKEVFSSVKPWLVIHGAAYADVDGCETDPQKADLINAQGTKNVAQACSQIGAKLIYISTDYVFDGEKGDSYLETDAVNPINAYGRSKLAGEEFVRSLVTESLIVRTSWLFGKTGKNFVETIISLAKQQKQLTIVSDQRGSPTHTVSLAKAIEMLIDSVFCDSGNPVNRGVYHVSNSDSCSWYDFAKRIVALKGIEVEILPVDSNTFMRPAKRPQMSVLDNSRYQKLTGDILCSWHKALENYLFAE
ncbi:MAG: dTDP-4-dehydrorhamnose reductase [Candidatus Omnitrophota bacterium]